MKKSKKFVLAGLVLAAITMVLLPLAGCKNDTVPPEVEKQEQGDGGGSETDKNNTAAKLISISVIPPTRTVYSVGQEFDPTGMKVTATYDDGKERPVTGTITTDTSTLTQSAGVQTVIVRYSEGGIEVSGQFEIRVLPTILTEGNWTYVEFGEWPQTIKDASVNVNETKSKQMGMFTYYLGSDDNYYVKITAKPYEDIYTYSDGNPVEKDMEVYFKVEPIVWRVLNKDYASTGKVLLLAESILTGGIPYYHFDREEGGLGGKVWSGPRIIEDKTIHPNNYEHSQIRAWLNGLSYQSKESEGAMQSSKDEYKNAGFLQTAFTEFAQDLIELTTVDNSAASTTDAGNNLTQADGCSDTTDKIFLLSEEEATTSEYGFAEYNVYVGDNDDTTTSTRIRVTTDYAKATGAYQGNSSAGYGGWWWLRSLCYDFVNCARDILINGNAKDGMLMVTSTIGGVVPALSISLGEN